MSPDRIKVLIVVLISVVAVSAGEALLSKGMKQPPAGLNGYGAQALAVVKNRYVIAGTGLMAVYFGLYMLALRWADLSFVLPLTALSYLLGAVLAQVYLRESVSLLRWLGAVIITVGVVIIGLGDKGPLRTH